MSAPPSFSLPTCLPICDPPTLDGTPEQRADEANERWPQAILLRLGGCTFCDAKTWLDGFANIYGGTLLLNGGTHLTGLAIDKVQGIHYPETCLELDSHIDKKMPFGVSTHNEQAVVLAAIAGASWVTVSPLARTGTHPDQPPLEWHLAIRCARLARRLGMQAFALGGIVPEDLDNLRSIGFDGVAGIRGFWAVGG